ncbi:MAG: triose-phosphate isomerase [Promethearchaeota archaeon]
MRKPIIGGNWKMNRGSPSEAEEMLKKLIPLVRNDYEDVDIVVAPPFTSIPKACELVKGTNIKISAQNMFFEERGAYTGEISPIFLKDLGCEYVILGHSERRDIFKENDDFINKKLRKALSMDLKPIVCVGEHLKEREAGNAKEIVQNQINRTFKDLSHDEMMSTIVAYEPIWAIGTGKTATPEQAEKIHFFIREVIAKNYSTEVASQMRIQYGGSIKPANALELFKQENIDGGLVGGASLQADSFHDIIKAAKKRLN